MNELLCFDLIINFKIQADNNAPANPYIQGVRNTKYGMDFNISEIAPIPHGGVEDEYSFSILEHMDNKDS